MKLIWNSSRKKRWEVRKRLREGTDAKSETIVCFAHVRSVVWIVCLWTPPCVIHKKTEYQINLQRTDRHRHRGRYCSKDQPKTRALLGIERRTSPDSLSDDVQCSDHGNGDFSHDAEGEKRQEWCREINVLSNDSARKDKSKGWCAIDRF